MAENEPARYLLNSASIAIEDNLPTHWDFNDSGPILEKLEESYVINFPRFFEAQIGL